MMAEGREEEPRERRGIAPIDPFLSSRGRPADRSPLRSFFLYLVSSRHRTRNCTKAPVSVPCSHRRSGYVTRRREAVGGNSGAVYLVAC